MIGIIGWINLNEEPGDIIISPMRFRIVKTLYGEHEKSISELATALDIDLKLTSFHVHKLVEKNMLQGAYRKRIVQNRPMLIQFFSLTGYAMSYLDNNGIDFKK